MNNISKITERQKSFFSRFGSSNIDNNLEEEIIKFKNRLILYLSKTNIFENIDIETTLYEFNTDYGLLYDEQFRVERAVSLSVALALNCGSTQRYPTQNGYNLDSIFTYITNYKNDKQDFLNLLEKLETFFNYCIYYCAGYDEKLSTFCSEIIQIVEKSSINLRLLDSNNKNKRLVFYPEGDEILDNALVKEVIPSLTENSYILYINSLVHFRNGDYTSSLTSMYQALEAWLKLITGSEKTGIKSITKSKVQESLNKKGCDNIISGYVVNILNAYEKYHNECGKSKHPSAKPNQPTKAELEFMIYQTGALIRFISQLLDYTQKT